MTDLDYEILDAVSKFPEGVTQSQLEETYFQGYELTYNLQELSKRDVTEVNGIRVTFSNSNILERKELNITKGKGFRSFYCVYFITPRGKTMLENWKRHRAELKEQELLKKRAQNQTAFFIGVASGVLSSAFTPELLEVISKVYQWLQGLKFLLK